MMMMRIWMGIFRIRGREGGREGGRDGWGVVLVRGEEGE